MPDPQLTISACPPQHVADALMLVLQDVAPSQRPLIAGDLLHAREAEAIAAAFLFAATRADELCGAAWAHRQPGTTAVFWPPRLVRGEPAETAGALTTAVTRALDRAAISMTQALLPTPDAEPAPLLLAAGYAHLTDLLYLACGAEHFPTVRPATGDLEFEPYDASQPERLGELVVHTYENTLDCPALDGRRRIEDVLDGYRSTGLHCADYWQIARSGGKDVGVVLLAEHPDTKHFELMYMGLAPEARGRGWGLLITQYAQWLARNAGAQRVVLAVDAANWPAAAMYARAGFAPWDRRSVFVRFFG